MAVFQHSGRVRKNIRQIRRTIGAKSGAHVVLDVISQLTTGIQVVVPVYWAYRRSLQPGAEVWQIYAYLVFVLYGLMYRLYLSKLFKPEHLVLEESRRPMRLSGAISKLTVALETGSISDKTLSEIERQALEAISSEVEAKVGDAIGGYLSANLIIPDPNDGSRLKCINRSNTHRLFPKSYRKEGMVAWAAIRDGVVQHEPNFNPKGEQPYRSILAFPLIYTPEEEREVRALGCVTVDHSKPHEFADLQGKLEIVLSPYLRLLELVLIYRSHDDKKRAKSRAR